MNLTTTTEGGLELHLDHAAEWLLVLAVLHDAESFGFDAAARVGGRMEGTDNWDDWREWVLPDIREGFQQHLRTVARAIQAGRGGKLLDPGVVTIPRTEFFDWYSALNQARLALEARYHFESEPLEDVGDGQGERRAAYFRGQFYLFLQSGLLDRGLG